MKALLPALLLAVSLRAAVAKPSTPSEMARADVTKASRRASERATDPAALVALAEAYLRQAQVTGESGGYGLAEAAIRRALSIDPSHYGALATKGWVEHGQHRFRAALESARKAMALAPEAAQNHALASDALLELGRYDEAIEALQKMLDLRPGPAAYSRAAHLRYLHGDLDGALEMVEMALESSLSSGARDLSAWLYTQAGEIHAARGDAAKAKASFRRALEIQPGYFRAAGPLSRLLAGEGDLDGALELAREAAEPAMLGTLEEIELARGNSQGAKRAAAKLEELARADLARHGRVDRALALIDLERERNLERAVKAAEADYAERPDIFSADVLAWARHRQGRTEEALKLSEEACRLGTPDGLLLYHRGATLMNAGRGAEARGVLAEAKRRGLLLGPMTRRRLGDLSAFGR